MIKKHLDIGCGHEPKNPYCATEVFGVDIYPEVINLGENFKFANLVTEKIPFEENFFDSVSAFDVLEHIPRQAINFQSNEMRQPFIELMDEIYRVLKPSGMFYAYTPAYPSSAAFQDPTHVNFISRDTHNYFCGERAYARRYGFQGNFECVEMRWLYSTYARSAKRSLAIDIKNLHKRLFKGGQTHLVWQLKAIKP